MLGVGGEWRHDGHRDRLRIVGPKGGGQQLVERRVRGRFDRRPHVERLQLHGGPQLLAEPFADHLAHPGLRRTGQVPDVHFDLAGARDHVELHARVDHVRRHRVAEECPCCASEGGLAHGSDGGIAGPLVWAADALEQSGGLGRKLLCGGREQPFHDRRQPRRLERREPSYDLPRPDRGIVLAWHRAVAPCAAHPDPVSDEAFLRDLDRVEAAAGKLDRHATGFVEGAGRAEPVGPVGGNPARSLHSACLFVGGRGEEHVTGQAGDRVGGGIPAGRLRLPGQHPHDREFHGDHALHVHRPAAPDVAIGDVAAEGIVGPETLGAPAPRRGATGGAAARRLCRRLEVGRPPSRGRGTARRPRAAARHRRGPGPRTGRQRSRHRAGSRSGSGSGQRGAPRVPRGRGPRQPHRPTGMAAPVRATQRSRGPLRARDRCPTAQLGLIPAT